MVGEPPVDTPPTGEPRVGSPSTSDVRRTAARTGPEDHPNGQADHGRAAQTPSRATTSDRPSAQESVSPTAFHADDGHQRGLIFVETPLVVPLGALAGSRPPRRRELARVGVRGRGPTPGGWRGRGRVRLSCDHGGPRRRVARRDGVGRAGPGRRRPVAGRRRRLARRRALRPRAARPRRHAQRRGRLPVLAPRRRRRRPGRPRAPVPRRDRELRARPQHRHRGAHGQRVRRGGRAHRRAAAAGTGAAPW